MFYHKVCMHPVVIENTLVKIVSEFTVTQKGIKPTLSEIIKTNAEKVDIKFYCPSCCDTVDISKIYGMCFNCGEILELNMLYKVSKHSGIYCKVCCEEYLADFTKKNVLNLIKITTGGNE